MLLSENTTGQIGNPALGKMQNTGGVEFFQNVLPKAISLLFVGGVVIFFFVLLIGAIQWISSGGDKQALEGARGKISNALIGLVILFSTFAVIKLIEAFFHISILSIDIGPLVIQ